MAPRPPVARDAPAKPWRLSMLCFAPVPKLSPTVPRLALRAPTRYTGAVPPGGPTRREPLMSETLKLLMEKDGPIRWIVFNQPDKRNAVSQEMWELMPKYVNDLATDDAIRVV